MKEFNRDDLLMTFDVNSLYPSAMYDENSVFILKLKQVMVLQKI